MTRVRPILAVLLLLVGALAVDAQPSPILAPTVELLPPVATSPALAPVAPSDLVARSPLGTGWLFGLELELVRPYLGGSLPAGDLDTTVAPHFLIGYRFPSGRSLHAEYLYFGSDTGDRVYRHVEGHVWDLDVRFLPRDLGFFFRTQWELGVRAANLSYDGDDRDTGYRASGRFWGIGPHLDWRVGWAFFDTGLELFAQSDLGLLIGRTDGFWRFDADDPEQPDSSRVALVGRWKLGASYVLNVGGCRVAVGGGYLVDGYNLTGLGVPKPNRLFDSPYVGLLNRGPFLRVEVRY